MNFFPESYSEFIINFFQCEQVCFWANMIRVTITLIEIAIKSNENDKIQAYNLSPNRKIIPKI